MTFVGMFERNFNLSIFELFFLNVFKFFLNYEFCDMTMIYDHENYVSAFCTTSVYATVIRLKEQCSRN
jgi:hypothetical protein